jgi:predicted transcriptional regulator of viral defense system
MHKIIEKILEIIPTDLISDTDLFALLPGTANSRYGIIKRLISAGDIIHVRRGLYCLAPKLRRQELNLFSVALKIDEPSYISFESALSYHGWIPEAVSTITSASLGKSKNFKNQLGVFNFKRVPTAIFYDEVERITVDKTAVFFMAKPFKALVDYIYVQRKNWLDFTPVVKSLRVEPEQLKTLKKRELASLKKNYPSRRVQNFIAGIEKELGFSPAGAR